MLQPQPTNASQPEISQRPSFTVAYELWLASWDAALAALTTASQSRMVSTNGAAAHKAAIVAEREVVTRHFTRLLGHRVALTTNEEVHRP